MGKITSSEQARKLSAKTQFKKGVSGNPNGRPKKIPAIDELLADVLGEEKDGMTAATIILKALRNKAFKGDVRAAEVLLDRAYGKASQPIDLSGQVDTVVKVGYGSTEDQGA